MNTLQERKSCGVRELIRPLKRPIKPYGKRNFFVLDVETREINGEIKFLFAYVLEYRYRKRYEHLSVDEIIKKSSQYHFFTSKSELTKFLFGLKDKKIKKKSTRLIIGHNIEFDLKFVDFKIAAENGFTLKKFMLNPTYMVFYHEEKDIRVVFLDTFNFYKTSLEKLFPNEKVKIDFSVYDYSDLKKLKERCKMDVFLTAKLAFNLKGISASDMSFKVFRQKKVYIQKIETEVAKKSYYGGRVECYVNSLRIENVKYYDFNSLYPSVMKGNLYPTKFIQEIENPSFDFVKTLIKKGFFIFAEVEVEVPENVKIPPFPFKGADGKLYFPVGRFTTYLAQPEIELGLQLGYIKKFIKVEEYFAQRIFDEFVEEYYRLRQEHPELKDYYKLILNSLYGKFGQREHETKIIEVNDVDFVGKIQDESGESYYIFNGYGFKTKTVDKRKYNVAIASAVTSYARVKLYNEIRKIDFNVVYVDTDSIFTTEKLETSSDLGKLKLECEGEFLGFRAKCYIIKDKVKFKGAKVSLQLLQKCGEEIEVEVERFPTFRDYIKNNGVVKKIKVIKKFNLIDDKRKGRGLTKPLNIRELVQRWKR